MEILILFLLMLLNGVFAMAEIAIVSARKSRLEVAAKKGDRNARRALKLAKEPGEFLSTVQIGITLIGLLTGIYSEDAITGDVEEWLKQFEVIAPYSGFIATTMVLVVITFFAMVLGELLPKRIGLIMPEKISKAVAWPMHILSVATAPFIWLLTNTTNLLIKIFGVRRKRDSYVTEEEVKAIVREGTDLGTIEEIEKGIVENVFHLGDRKISSLMTMRREVLWLDINDTLEVNKRKIIETDHKSLPVCDKDLDKVKGILFAKHMLNGLLEDKDYDIRQAMVPATFFPENTSAYRALEMFNEAKTNFAIVIDEFGGVEGILTINDLLNALVGDLESHLYEEREIVKRRDGSYLVAAATPLPEFMRYFDIMPKKEYDDINTFGGLVFYISGKIPEIGYTFSWEGYSFRVISMEDNRVVRVLMQKEVEAD